MPRPQKPRACRAFEGERVFKPRNVPLSELATIPLSLAELEALRCCDLEGLTQAQAGTRLRISRGTVQRLVKSGRLKVVRALVESAALVIEEGGTDAVVRADHG